MGIGLHLTNELVAMVPLLTGLMTAFVFIVRALIRIDIDKAIERIDNTYVRKDLWTAENHSLDVRMVVLERRK
jgi:hypothetical protein